MADMRYDQYHTGYTIKPALPIFRVWASKRGEPVAAFDAAAADINDAIRQVGEAGYDRAMVPVL